MKWHRTGTVLTLLITLGTATAAVPATAAPATTVVQALDHAAHPPPLSAALERGDPHRTVEPGGGTGDLRPLDRMIGDAKVVGVGEATHGSHDFIALKDRVFRHLVEEKGFRTFALEAPWSTGLRLDAYVRHGKGDPRRIMREEFQRDYLWWNNTAYLRLVEWMRAHNVRHPGDPVRFIGFLRETLGAGYVSVGVTFDRGSFNATGLDEEAVRRWTLGPAGPGSNERTLDRVRHRDYVVDLRSAGSPAREWLAKARPTRTIGTAYPDGPNDIALSRSHDILIHLHEVEASTLRDV
ncbi:erythromycin esterase family protein [Streptomyces sp. NPDC002814]